MITAPQTWEAAVDACLAEMRSVMIERQNAYGPENIRQQGLFGVLTRGAADKTARIMRALNGKITEGHAELDEIEDDSADSFGDALLDAANYFGVIAVMLRRGWWDLPRAQS